ncbi:hypothetical protein SPONN_1379 [uncultured Candidatus Thioglobus sp.]|nr:hypothetical protein SPONN_1379 [uncultured Candidatus Thioglobus sp.]
METVEQIEARIEQKITAYKANNKDMSFTNDKTLVFELLEGVKDKLNDDDFFNANILDIEDNIRNQLKIYYGLR